MKHPGFLLHPPHEAIHLRQSTLEATMPTDKAAIDEFKAMIEKIEREAYARGWSDAIRRIQEIAAKEGSVSIDSTEKDQDEGRATATRSAYGIVPKLVTEALEFAGRQGTTIERIQDHVANAAPDVRQSSIRGTIRRMEKRGKMYNLGDHWFLARFSKSPSMETAGTVSKADPAEPVQSERRHAMEPP
jgi:hypothetical protein